jgi:hypothetical protein
MTLQTNTVRWYFTESCKNTYWKCIIDVDTDGYSPSTFGDGPKLPIESPTDNVNSKRRALIHLFPRTLADEITDGLRNIWRVIKKFWGEIQNLLVFPFASNLFYFCL